MAAAKKRLVATLEVRDAMNLGRAISVKARFDATDVADVITECHILSDTERISELITHSAGHNYEVQSHNLSNVDISTISFLRSILDEIELIDVVVTGSAVVRRNTLERE